MQTLVAGVGSLSASSTDAVVHFLIHSSDDDFLALMELLAEARSLSETEPLASARLLEHLWVAAEASEQSRVFRTVGWVFRSTAWVVDLYGPLLGLLVVVATVAVGVPMVRNLLRYPLQRLSGLDERSLGRFIWDEIKVMFREVRAALWTIVVIFIVTAVAVAAVRLTTLPIVAIALQSLFAAHTHVEGGGALPDVALVLTAVSLSVTMALVGVSLLGCAGLVVSRAYRVSRARLVLRRRIWDFPGFFELCGRGTRAVAAALVAVGVSIGFYWVIAQLLGERAAWAMWLPGPIVGPVTVLLMIWLQVFPRIRALVSLDVLRSRVPRVEGS